MHTIPFEASRQAIDMAFLKNLWSGETRSASLG